jgi:hypothetical protein
VSIPTIIHRSPWDAGTEQISTLTGASAVAVAGRRPLSMNAISPTTVPAPKLALDTRAQSHSLPGGYRGEPIRKERHADHRDE